MEQLTATLKQRSEEVPASQAQIGNHAGAISTTWVHTPSMLYYTIKRVADIFLAVIGIVLLLPLFLLIGLCIKLDDGGDVLHFREIIGMHGKRFYALKFRTMRADADEYLAGTQN